MENSTLMWFAVACIAGVFTLLIFTGGGIQTGDGGIPPTNAFDKVRTQTDNKTTTAINANDILDVRGIGIEINQYIPSAVGWCDVNYSYRKTITIDSTEVINANQTNFPFMYNVTDTDIEARAESNGDDIIFCDENQNQIPHDLDEWASGHLLAWVNVPNVYENIDTDLYVYYDYDSVGGATEDEDNTWGSDYWGVWHWNNNLVDSSGNGNHGILDSGIECYTENSVWGTGVSWDNDGQCVGYSRAHVDNFPAFSYTQEFTLNVMASEHENTGADIQFLQRDSGVQEVSFVLNGNNADFILIDANANKIRLKMDSTPNWYNTYPQEMGTWLYNGTGFSSGWQHWEYAEPNYLTTVLVNSTSANPLDSDISTEGTAYFGKGSSIARGYFGTVGELQFLTTVWTGDKVQTVQNNYYVPDTFYSTNSEFANPNLNFVADRAIEFSLIPPTSTVLGGVLATDCPSGEFVNGINTTDGGIICDTP